MKYKVWFRQVYTETFRQWLEQMFWCHIVIKVFPHVHDFGSDSLTRTYIEEPAVMQEQLRFLLLEAAGLPAENSPL